MAFGDPPTGPDFGAMLALNNFTNQQNGKPAPILCFLPGGGADVNIKQLSCQGNGFNIDAMPVRFSQARPGWLAKILADMGCTSQNLTEGFSNAAKGAPLQQIPFQQVNNITEITGPGLPGAGSFVATMSNPRGGGILEV